MLWALRLFLLIFSRIAWNNKGVSGTRSSWDTLDACRGCPQNRGATARSRKLFHLRLRFREKKGELEKFRDMKLVFLLVFLSCCQTWPMPRRASCYCCYLLPRYRSACNVTFLYSDLIEWFPLVNVTNVRNVNYVAGYTAAPFELNYHALLVANYSYFLNLRKFALILRRCYHSWSTLWI